MKYVCFFVSNSLKYEKNMARNRYAPYFIQTINYYYTNITN